MSKRTFYIYIYICILNSKIKMHKNDGCANSSKKYYKFIRLFIFFLK